ncbi:MAG: 16S rRNA (uracil(1498)-N(3))-methyltransferase, partial [Spirochaetaceae bacterium]|nr:16S rRNA (uracil(1498)-N(3))-methyltransferase [Spirochaetaceae bacterium]
MKQFILPDAPDEDGVIRLTGDDFHYLARVRRMREGDMAGCRLPSGKLAEMKIKSVGEGILLAECKPKDGESHPKNRLPPIILFQSILKGAKMDAVVRQAGETGIKEIVPFYSERSVPRPACGERSPQARTGRWQRILRTAQQQSGSETPAGVACPCSADYLFDYWTRIRDHSQKALALLIHEVPL